MALTIKPSAVGSNTGSVVIMSTAGNGSLTINTSVTGKVPKVKK
jgi:hypothetical protein